MKISQFNDYLTGLRKNAFYFKNSEKYIYLMWVFVTC